MSRKFTERAAAAFMLVGVTVKRWEGAAKLKKGAADAAAEAGANPVAFRGYVDLLGKHHRDLKKVVARYKRVYNFLEERTLPYDRGEYAVPTALIPQLLQDLNRLIAKADDERDKFLLDYERLAAVARSDDMGRWAGELSEKYPSVDEVRARFGVTIKTPKALPVSDMSKLNLPADLAAQIADQQAEMLDAKLAQAKEAALDAVSNSLANVHKQLDGGERFHQSLIDNLRRDCVMLREMTKGYDADPRLLTLADQIESEVLNVDKVEDWRHESDKKVRTLPGLSAKAAADKAVKSLGSIRKSNAAKATPKGKVKVGGLVGKRMAAKS